MLLDLEGLVKKYNMYISGVVHAGGHFGQEIPLYHKLGIPKDKIIVFEAVPETFNILEQNCKGQAILVNQAVGDYTGEVEINLETANQGQSSSILPSKLHSRYYPHITFDKKIKVPITTLDDYLIDNGLTCGFNFLMGDLQGAELMLLKGAKCYLNSVDYIMLEVNCQELYEGCPHVEDLDEFLSPYGFERTDTCWVDGVGWGDGFWQR